jgi:hypothetical protein
MHRNGVNIMAKGHEFTLVKLWMGDKEIPLTNHLRLRYTLGYSVKHTGDAVSTHYNHIFDIECSALRHMEMDKNSFTIKFANDELRPLSRDAAQKKYPRGCVIKYEDIFPGKRTHVVTKEMSPSEIRAKCVADPDFRAQVMKELMEMEDGETTNNGE